MMYWISRNLLKLFLKSVTRLTVRGVENIPKTGGVILAPNHVSFLDPPVVGSACPRKIRFMAKEELFRVPLLKYWMRAVETFPVRPETADRQAVKKAVELLRQGECVCVFPEGTRVAPGMKSRAMPGIALIARLSGAPVVPAAITGTQPWRRKIFGCIWWYRPVEVRFGQVMRFSFEKETRAGGEILQKVADEILARIEALKRA